jgi:predicted polyphosphate/ATP-dependent NAD kinase
VDIVMTPTAGLGLLVAEDALDRYVVERIERRTDSRYARILSRMALNPTRTAANLLRFKKPWHRDAGLR